nr:hypothetical protein [Bacteroidota bacterium]
DTKEHKELINKYNSKRGIKKSARILRLFVIDALQNYFRENNFVPHFLPTILYQGLKNIHLLHFTIFGAKERPGVGRTTWLQSIGELCDEKLITPQDGKFELIEEDDIERAVIKNINSVQLFSNSKTFKTVWKKQNDKN